MKNKRNCLILFILILAHCCQNYENIPFEWEREMLALFERVEVKKHQEGSASWIYNFVAKNNYDATTDVMLRNLYVSQNLYAQVNI